MALENSGLFREKSLQSEKDVEQIDKLSNYIKHSPGELITKFDNFPKYVQRTSLSRFLSRYEIFKLQLDVVGSILDLGVGRGASLMSWAQLSAMFEPVNFTREIIGFDTFAGVSSLNEEKDINAHNRDSNLLVKGGFAVENGMFEDIQEAIGVYDTTRYLNHIEKVKVVKGDITKTLPKFLNENPHMVVSLLHLDIDIYEPTKLALELLFERIPKGGILVFDELNAKMYPGETLALKETLGLKSLKIKRFPWATTISYAIVE